MYLTIVGGGDISKLLSEKGFIVDGKTMLMVCAEKNYENFEPFLEQAGQTVEQNNCKFSQGDADYQYAPDIKEGYNIRKLDKHARIILGEGKKTALMLAAERGHLNIVEALEDREGYITNKFGLGNLIEYTAAHYAAMNGFGECVTELQQSVQLVKGWTKILGKLEWK